MKFRNFTPHEINIHREDGTIVTLPSEGVIRAKQSFVMSETFDGIEVATYAYGEPEGVPEVLDKDSFYIVSKIALDACNQHGVNTYNFLMVGEVVRDDDGKIIGCKTLSRG